MNFSATRMLVARSKTTGKEIELKILIGVPCQEKSIEAAECSIVLEGMFSSPKKIRGIDEIDALHNAMEALSKIMIGIRDAYDLFWPDGEPFEL